MADVRIVIAQRGWVFCGYVTREETEIVIRKCKNIRRWGTTKGLGEIACNGPTGRTVLDEAGTVRLHPLSLVGQIDADPSKWEDALK